MEYVLNKSLEKNRKLGLYASGRICHVFQDKQEELQNCGYNGVLKCGFIVKNVKYTRRLCRDVSVKRQIFKAVRRGIVDGSAHLFTRYHEKDITGIRSRVSKKESKFTKNIVGYDAYLL